MDGGLAQWIKEGHPVVASTGPSDVEKKKFESVLQPDLVKRFEDMTSNIEKARFQVMDARSSERFNGEAPEPREGLCTGHLPNSCNMFFASTMHGDDSATPRLMKSSEELAQIFKDRGVDLSRPLTATCGSGVTACILTLAAYQAGKQNVAVYDGSWEEYGQRATLEQMVVAPTKENSAG